LKDKANIVTEDFIFIRRFLNYLLENKKITDEIYKKAFIESKELSSYLTQEIAPLIKDRSEDSIVAKYRHDYIFDKYRNSAISDRSNAIKKIRTKK
jgi:hypothetical protein